MMDFSVPEVSRNYELLRKAVVQHEKITVMGRYATDSDQAFKPFRIEGGGFFDTIQQFKEKGFEFLMTPAFRRFEDAEYEKDEDVIFIGMEKLLEWGLVYKINQIFLHPLGMALYVDDSRSPASCGVMVANGWEYTEKTKLKGEEKYRQFLQSGIIEKIKTSIQSK